RHFVFPARKRNQFNARQPLIHRQRPLAQPGEITEQLMKLDLFPLIARMIVALRTLNLDAEEEAAGLGGLLHRRIGAKPGSEEKVCAVLAIIVGLARTFGADHGTDDLVPSLVLFELIG